MNASKMHTGGMSSLNQSTMSLSMDASVSGAEETRPGPAGTAGFVNRERGAEFSCESVIEILSLFL